jgi:hypothetical protein
MKMIILIGGLVHTIFDLGNIAMGTIQVCNNFPQGLYLWNKFSHNIFINFWQHSCIVPIAMLPRSKIVSTSPPIKIIIFICYVLKCNRWHTCLKCRRFWVRSLVWLWYWYLCFSAKQAVLKSENINRLARNQDNVSERSDMSTYKLLVQWERL